MDDTTRDSTMEISFSDVNLSRQLFGEHNKNLGRIADALAISLNVRGNTVYFKGDAIAVDLAKNLLNQLYGLIREGYPVYPRDIDHALKTLSSDDRVKLRDLFIFM